MMPVPSPMVRRKITPTLLPLPPICWTAMRLFCTLQPITPSTALHGTHCRKQGIFRWLAISAPLSSAKNTISTVLALSMRVHRRTWDRQALLSSSFGVTLSRKARIPLSPPCCNTASWKRTIRCIIPRPPLPSMWPALSTAGWRSRGAWLPWKSVMPKKQSSYTIPSTVLLFSPELPVRRIAPR